MKILHVAAIELIPNSGMGRISYEWKLAFEKAGYHFQHIGLKELGQSVHPLLFGKYVRDYIIKNNIAFDVLLAHEPASGFLYFKNSRLVVFSHGVEERAWHIQKQFGFERLSLKSRTIPGVLRFYSNNRGFRKCSAALLSNTDDLVYLRDQKGIKEKKLRIFHNGFYPIHVKKLNHETITFLFNATWIPRKGIDLIATVFAKLMLRHQAIKLILAGTKWNIDEVFARFPKDIHHRIAVINSFSPEEEASFYKEADIFLMPSFFEGQSVALTQAMAMELCPIVSDNSGQKDFVKHQHNGLLFKTGDAADFEEKIEWLLHHPDQIRVLGEKAKQSVALFTWENTAGEVVSMCESVMQH